jgi:hypothetical protein
MRVTQFQQAAAGFGAISFNTSDIAASVVKAVMPAIRKEMPGLVSAAMPAVRAEMPGLVASAMPHVKAQIPAMMPVVAEQLPVLVDSAMPMLQAKLPALTKQVSPIVRKEFEDALDQYAKTYLGPTAQFKEWAPALAMVAAGVTLFASSLVIYQYWAGEL